MPVPYPTPLPSFPSPSRPFQAVGPTPSKSREGTPWGSHEPPQSQYNGPNQTSSGTPANYSPINEEGQQWSAGPCSSNGISNPPSWQNILQDNPSSTSPISSPHGLPRTSSTDQSLIPSPAEAPYSAN